MQTPERPHRHRNRRGLGLCAHTGPGQAITLNAIADYADDDTLSGYFRRFVISHDGFVVRAKGLAGCPRAIHGKLLCERTKAVT